MRLPSSRQATAAARGQATEANNRKRLAPPAAEAGGRCRGWGLEVLLWALVDGWDKHRRTCRLAPCPHLHDAIREVVDWREARILLSRAEALRAAERAGSQAPMAPKKPRRLKLRKPRSEPLRRTA